MKTQKPKSLNDHKPLYYYTDNNIKLPKDYHIFNGLVIPLYGITKPLNIWFSDSIIWNH